MPEPKDPMPVMPYVDWLGIAKQAVENAVVVSDGGFQEHPEAFRPRVFVKTEHGGGKCYEILQDGQAIPWPKAPDAAVCGFDFWLINADALKDITMKRRTDV